MSTTEPIVEDIRWHGNTCTVGETNFSVSVNPDGLAAIFDVDSRILARPLFDHTLELVSYLHHNRMPMDALETVAGFRDLHAWLRSRNPYRGPLFPYDIHCRIDSPLIGWFLVLGAKDERPSDTRRRDEQQIFNAHG